MAARVITRKIPSDQEQAFRSILGALNGDDDPTEHQNVGILIKIRQDMYKAGMTLVVQLISLARALNSEPFSAAVAEIRDAHSAMFKNLDFRMDVAMLSDERRTALKAEHIATRRHQFVTKALEVTAALTVAGFGKEIEGFDDRFIALPFKLLDVEIVGAATKAGCLQELPTLLRAVYSPGRGVYDAAMAPEIDADLLFDTVTTALDALLTNTRGCKRAIKMVQAAKATFRNNMVDYLKMSQIQGNPMVIIEMLVADVQKEATSGAKVPFTEFAVLLKELRKLSNKVQKGSGEKPNKNLDKVLDGIGSMLESITSTDSASAEEIMAQSTAVRAQLSEALSSMTFE